MQATVQQPQRAPDGAPVHYERHRPEQTTLYRLVQQHAATFFAEAEAAAGADLPQFVKDEFDAFLECGILAHGFLRLRCGDFGDDKLVANSRKRRGFCPSCGARRMAQTATHLVDQVIPHVPVRQWVRSVCVAQLLYTATMRSATFPPIRVEPEVRAEVEAVLREGESLTQFIEEAVVAAAAWRRVQAEFVTRGEAAIARWKHEGGGHTVDDVMDDLQTRLDGAKRRAAQRAGR